MKPHLPSIFKIMAFAFAECRGAWRRFLFFIICLSIGVAAVMTIDSFSKTLNKTIFQEARSLLAADLEIKSSICDQIKKMRRQVCVACRKRDRLATIQ